MQLTEVDRLEMRVPRSQDRSELDLCLIAVWIKEGIQSERDLVAISAIRGKVWDQGVF